MKNTCILVALLWLRGANVFVAMRARSLQKFWDEFVGLKDAGALQFMIATGWDYGGGGECVRMDVFSNKDGIMNVKGDLASRACFEAYSTTGRPHSMRGRRRARRRADAPLCAGSRPPRGCLPSSPNA